MNLIGLCIPTIIALLAIWLLDYAIKLKIILTIICLLIFLIKFDTNKGGHSIHGGRIYIFLEKHMSYTKSEFCVAFILLFFSLVFGLVALSTKIRLFIIMGGISLFIEILSMYQLVKYTFEDSSRKRKKKNDPTENQIRSRSND